MKFVSNAAKVLNYLIAMSPLFLLLIFVPPYSELKGASSLGQMMVFIPWFISYYFLIPLNSLLHLILLIVERTQIPKTYYRGTSLTLLLSPYLITVCFQMYPAERSMPVFVSLSLLFAVLLFLIQRKIDRL